MTSGTSIPLRGGALVAALCLALGACGNNDNNTKKTTNNNTAMDMATDMTVTDMTVADMGADMTVADMSADMSRPDGIVIPGLSGEAKIRIDDRGIPHVDCKTDNDCYAVQGYLHARDRFAQMDLRRRFARGRVSTLVGDLALDIDIQTRRMLTTRDGTPLEEAMWAEAKPETKAAFEAYTRGVNAWLGDLKEGRNGAKLSEEYEFPALVTDTIPAWEPLDSVAAVLVLLEDLSNQASVEAAWGEAVTKADPAIANDLFSGMSAMDTNTLGAIGLNYKEGGVSTGAKLPPQAGASALSKVRERLRAHQGMLKTAAADMARYRKFQGKKPFDFTSEKGSNNWVLGPKKSQNNRAILAGDPHLQLTNPALWYLVEVNSKQHGGDLHFSGVSFAGLPGVLIGHNEDVAWTGTVVFYDLSDLYVEEFTGADRKKVKFKGGEVEVIEKEFTFEVAGKDPVKRTFKYVPHHGPVISEGTADNLSAMTLRWVGHDARTDINFFLDVVRAKNLDEAKTALSSCTATNQNWVVIDKDNNIGWFPFSKVPVRPWASKQLPPWMPLPGDGSAEWEGFMPYDELPQVTNPEAGFIATANQDMSGALLDGDPTNDGYNTLQTAPAIGFRHQRIVDVIRATESFTPATASALQGDTLMVIAQQDLPVWLGDLDGNEQFNADETRAVDILKAWKYTCPTGLAGSDPTMATPVADAEQTAESQGCLVFHYLMYQMSRYAFFDELDGTNISTGYSAIMRALHVLTTDPQRFGRGEAYWDDLSTSNVTETRKDILIKSIKAIIPQIKQDVGANAEAWRWGSVHQLILKADLLSGLVDTFNAGPFVAPGGAFTVNVAIPADGASRDWTFSHGPSMRFIAEATDKGIISSFNLPGGQPHFRDDPLYNALVDEFLQNKQTPMPFLAEDTAALNGTTLTCLSDQ